MGVMEPRCASNESRALQAGPSVECGAVELRGDQDAVVSKRLSELKTPFPVSMRQ